MRPETAQIVNPEVKEKALEPEAQKLDYGAWLGKMKESGFNAYRSWFDKEILGI